MTRPLGSTPPRPAGASRLLRTGPPARPATVLTASTVAAARQLPLAILDSSVEACLPTFHARAADLAHVAYMPDTAWPEKRTPARLIPADLLRPGFDVTLLIIDTSTATPEKRGLRTVFPIPT